MSVGAASLLALSLCMVQTGIVYSKTYTRCRAGYLYDPATDECVHCSDGHYLELNEDEVDHNRTECERCTVFNEHDPNAIKIEDCTRTHDTKIKCVNGFYRNTLLGKCDTCVDCASIGKFLAKACTDYEDTKCCPKPGMGFHDEQCVELVTCSYGQYFVFLGFKDGKDLGQCSDCLTLGTDFTNKEDGHRRQKCEDKIVQDHTQQDIKLENHELNGVRVTNARTVTWTLMGQHHQGSGYLSALYVLTVVGTVFLVTILFTVPLIACIIWYLMRRPAPGGPTFSGPSLSNNDKTDKSKLY